MKPPLMANEFRNPQGLDGVPDASPGHPLDDFAVLAATICEARVALISLADGSRHWSGSAAGIRESGDDIARRASGLAAAGVLVAGDTLCDGRFSGFSWVKGDPGVRFYAGFPLVLGDDELAGTLVVMDTVPRDLS